MGAYTRSCWPSTKNAFFKVLFLQTKENNWESKTYTQTEFANKGQQCFYAPFQRLQLVLWLTASTKHKLFCRPCCVYFLIRVKGNGMTDPWTLFTSDRWVCYYLMSIVSCTLLWRHTILMCGVWMSSICPVFLLCLRHHFWVTWMCIVTRVLADYFYWPCRKMYYQLLISRNCCWEPVCGIICALYTYGCVYSLL